MPPQTHRIWALCIINFILSGKSSQPANLSCAKAAARVEVFKCPVAYKEGTDQCVTREINREYFTSLLILTKYWLPGQVAYWSPWQVENTAVQSG